MSYALPPVVQQGNLTENELAWVVFLRLLSEGSDPVPSLAAVQALRLVFNPSLAPLNVYIGVKA